MVSLDFSDNELAQEIERITNFIWDQAKPNHKLLLGVSGGIDSDVTARLCVRAVGPRRMRCFIVLQDEFDPKYVDNARRLAQEMDVKLVEIPFAPIPAQLISIMAEADTEVGFVPDPSFLDVGRSKCAIRTFIFSAYAERGYLVVGSSNKRVGARLLPSVWRCACTHSPNRSSLQDAGAAIGKSTWNPTGGAFTTPSRRLLDRG